MFEKYLTIGEVAKIKGVHIKSLRYYDQIGILKPAYVNPETGYRYYSQKQLFMVDDIQFCIELGMPLAQLRQYYVDADGLDMVHFLQDAQILARQKLQTIERGLQMIEKTLGNISERQALPAAEGLCSRYLSARQVVLLPFEDCSDQMLFFAKLTELFALASALGVDATYPAGRLYVYQPEGLKRYVFLEVLETDQQDSRLWTIPAGFYFCEKIATSKIEQARQCYPHCFAGQGSQMVIETDWMDPVVRYDHFMLELQIQQA